MREVIRQGFAQVASDDVYVQGRFRMCVEKYTYACICFNKSQKVTTRAAQRVSSSSGKSVSGEGVIGGEGGGEVGKQVAEVIFVDDRHVGTSLFCFFRVTTTGPRSS